MMRKPTTLAVTILSLTLLFVACGASERRVRPPGSALWVGAEAALDRDTLEALEAASVDDLFLEVAELIWDDREPRLRTAVLEGPGRRKAATLAVRGVWQEEDPEAAARGLSRALRQLRIESEFRGLIPLGFHFDVDASQNLKSYGEALQALKARVDDRLLLSATVQAAWLESPGIETIAAGVDFLVPVLYGQPVGAEEDSRLWDLEVLQQHVHRLEGLTKDYLVGVMTLGTLSHLRGEEERMDTTSRASLRDLVTHPALEVESGFVFEGFHRQVIDLKAKRRAAIGEWKLGAGDRLRVVRPMTANLEQLNTQLASLDLEHHLGQLYYRLPHSEEELSLSVNQVVNALTRENATPEIEVEVGLLRRTTAGWSFRVSLHNRGEESTALALQDANYVELRTDRGAWGQVDLGDFQRWTLHNSVSPGRSMRSLRGADSLRLHYPILDGGWSVASGPVELNLRGSTPELTVSGRFVLPDGRTLELPPKQLSP